MEKRMNGPSATGLLVFGIVLGVVGAIMKFAVTATATGFDVPAAGIILVFVGIGTAVVGLGLLVVGTRRRSSVTESIQQTPTGQVRTETRSDSGSES